MSEKKAKLPTAAEVEERDRVEEAKVSVALRSASGATILAFLSKRYDRSMVKRVEGGALDVHQTMINIGAREVVKDLEDLRDRETEE